MAYEMKSGPLGPRWGNELLADMHYLMQWTTYLLGAQLTPEGKKNQVPEPKPIVRPWDIQDEEDDEEEE